jgi:hypothetical protein
MGAVSFTTKPLEIKFNINISNDNETEISDKYISFNSNDKSIKYYINDLELEDLKQETIYKITKEDEKYLLAEIQEPIKKKL